MTWPEFSQAVTALAAIGAVMASMRNSKKIDGVHVSLNSRLTEMLESIAKAKDSEKAAAVKEASVAGHAAGLQQGQAQATHSIAQDKAEIP